MPKENKLWVARTRLHRLVRWIDGVETEFPIAFGNLSAMEQEYISEALKTIVDELDDYYSTSYGGMPVVTKVTEMRGPQERIL